MTEITFGIYYNEKPEMETTDAGQLIQYFGHMAERMHNLLCVSHLIHFRGLRAVHMNFDKRVEKSETNTFKAT